MVEPVILELAVNGSTSRHRNRHVPRTPVEITEAALAGIESGASIVHIHNDERESGLPTAPGPVTPTA